MRLVPRLAEAGHVVTGMTRTPGRTAEPAAIGPRRSCATSSTGITPPDDPRVSLDRADTATVDALDLPSSTDTITDDHQPRDHGGARSPRSAVNRPAARSRSVFSR
jgi:hypothetical protein